MIWILGDLIPRKPSVYLHSSKRRAPDSKNYESHKALHEALGEKGLGAGARSAAGKHTAPTLTARLYSLPVPQDLYLRPLTIVVGAPSPRARLRSRRRRDLRTHQRGMRPDRP